MHKLFFFTLLMSSLLSKNSISQPPINLIPNNSFERCKELPHHHSQAHLLYNWYSGRTSGYPINYFNTLSFKPKKIIGKEQFPYQGNAFIALGTDLGNELHYSQFIETQLIQPLLKDSLYTITLYVCLAINFRYAIDHLECRFFERKFLYSSKMNVDKSELIILKADTGFINDPKKWIKLTGTYKAKGDENYFVLGNFSFSYKKSRLPFNPSLLYFVSSNATFYLIDEVSVIKSTQPMLDKMQAEEEEEFLPKK